MSFKPFRAFKNSCNGLQAAWCEDHSFRMTVLQFVLGVALACGLSAYYHWSPMLWLLLVGSLFPMVIAETINSGIEAVTDKASPERHPLAKKAKDIGSAAVLISRILAALCWIVGISQAMHTATQAI